MKVHEFIKKFKEKVDDSIEDNMLASWAIGCACGVAGLMGGDSEYPVSKLIDLFEIQDEFDDIEEIWSVLFDIKTEKSLVLSTAHIRYTSIKHLDENETNLPYGWRVWVEKYNDQPDEIKDIIKIARSLDCKYVEFDQDVPPCDFLPTWEW